MKLALLIVAACAFVQASGLASEGRYLARSGVLAARGEQPHVVHIRMTTTRGPYLRTCIGSVLSGNWILTTASCVRDARFIWARFGTVNVLNPELVLEVSLVTSHPDYDATTKANDIGLINFSRVVEMNANIQPVTINANPLTASATTNFCGFGNPGSISVRVPGNDLRCLSLQVQLEGNYVYDSSTLGDAGQFDDGAPLVVNGQQVGIFNYWASQNRLTFLPVSNYVSWLSEATGLNF